MNRCIPFFTAVLLAITQSFAVPPSAEAQERRAPQTENSSDEVACKEGDVERCLAFAESLEPGTRATNKSLAAATTRFLAECKEDLAESCYNAGIHIANGFGAVADQKRGASYLALACKKKHVKACNMLGLYFQRGWGVPKKPENAFELYKVTCIKAKDGEGCFMLARAYAEGVGVEADMVNAIPHFTFSCKEGVPRACEELGFHTLKGNGITRDVARATTLFEGACESGRKNSCAIAGAIHAGAWSETHDRDKALHYSKRACSLGQRAGCARAKQLESKRWKPTYPQFVKGCRTGCIDNGKQDLEPGALTGENLVNMCESTCACMTDALVRHSDFVGFEDTNAALGAMKDVNEDTRYLACVEEAAERLVK